MDMELMSWLQIYAGLGTESAAAAAKSLQSCPTLCDPIDGGPPGSAVPGILQARTLEWVAISFSNAWKWKWSRSVVSYFSRPHGLQPTRLLHPWDFPGKNTGVGCHCLLQGLNLLNLNITTLLIQFWTFWIQGQSEVIGNSMTEMDSIKESKQGEEGMKAGREREKGKSYMWFCHQKENQRKY